ncbi:hypothetical protein BBJ41_36905 [Burkholderia stabilis]|nr:hypothetical protein BBJ41_36905 [Burkholderia stabilis]
MRKVMKAERQVGAAAVTHQVVALIDGLFRKRQPQAWSLGDTRSKCERLIHQLRTRNHSTDHAEPMCIRGSQTLRGKEQFLRAATAQFPWMSKQLDTRDTKINCSIGKIRIVTCDNQVA